MGTTIPGRRKKAEQDQIFNLSVSIWALQVTPKLRSGKITTRASIFKIEILNALIIMSSVGLFVKAQVPRMNP